MTFSPIAVETGCSELQNSSLCSWPASEEDAAGKDDVTRTSGNTRQGSVKAISVPVTSKVLLCGSVLLSLYGELLVSLCFHLLFGTSFSFLTGIPSLPLPLARLA